MDLRRYLQIQRRRRKSGTSHIDNMWDSDPGLILEPLNSLRHKCLQQVFTARRHQRGFIVRTYNDDASGQL